MKVFEAVFQYIDQLIIPIRIRRHHEEAMLQNIVAAITDDAFYRLAVMKSDPHPQPLHDRCILMEVQGPVPQVPVEGLYEEDRFGISSGHILKGIRINQLEPNGVELRHRFVAQQLVDCAELTCLGEPAHSMVFIADDDSVCRR